jgi:hypothetical protein
MQIAVQMLLCRERAEVDIIFSGILCYTVWYNYVSIAYFMTSLTPISININNNCQQ